jgi:hypothetical protein
MRSSQHYEEKVRRLPNPYEGDREDLLEEIIFET